HLQVAVGLAVDLVVAADQLPAAAGGVVLLLRDVVDLRPVDRLARRLFSDRAAHQHAARQDDLRLLAGGALRPAQAAGNAKVRLALRRGRPDAHPLRRGDVAAETAPVAALAPHPAARAARPRR